MKSKILKEDGTPPWKIDIEIVEMWKRFELLKTKQKTGDGRGIATSFKCQSRARINKGKGGRQPSYFFCPSYLKHPLHQSPRKLNVLKINIIFPSRDFTYSTSLSKLTTAYFHPPNWALILFIL